MNARKHAANATKVGTGAGGNKMQDMGKESLKSDDPHSPVNEGINNDFSEKKGWSYEQQRQYLQTKK